MCPANFKPLPTDTSRIDLPSHLHELVEILAANTHDVCAQQRLLDEWGHGQGRDDAGKKHYCLIPYQELPESEKQYDRNTAVETLKLILKLGYNLLLPKATGDIQNGSPISSHSQFLDQVGSLNLSSLIALWHSHTPGEWSNTPEVYKQLGERVLKLGEPLLAFDVLTEGLASSQTDVRLRQLLALSLARSGATQRANSILTQLRKEGHHDEETLGILARTHKDLWTQAIDLAERERQLALAYEFYDEAYRLNGGYYAGINAATLGLLLGKKDRARELAREVKRACVKELDHLGEKDAYRYWPLATLGEASLILRRWSEAEDRYAQAAEIGRGQFAELGSTRRNARLILDYLGRDAKGIENCFQIPKVVVFAGHLIDRPGRPTPRFPPQLEPAVRSAIRSRLKKLGAGFGYASLACGSDILFLEALIENGAEAHVVLPYDKKRFVKDSVTILPGTNWGARFEQVLARANEIITASSQRLGEGSMSFQYTNLVLQGLAHMKASQLETEMVPLAVWDQKPGDGPDGTADMIGLWQSLGLSVEIIDLAKILRRQCPNLVSKDNGPPAIVSKRRTGSRKFTTRIMAMLFADAVHFSKLTERQIPLFMQEFLGTIATLVAESSNAPVVKNTWGDGLYFVFQDVRDAGLFALELCEDLNRRNWTDKGLPATLNLRIALHAGPVYSCTDPVLQQQTYTGTHVSRTARMEPITPPGQVYASQAFAALAAAQGVREFTCDYVGQTPLAKGYGTFPTFHVRRCNTGT